MKKNWSEKLGVSRYAAVWQQNYNQKWGELIGIQFYFESKAEGEVRIFRFLQQQTSKQNSQFNVYS